MTGSLVNALARTSVPVRSAAIRTVRGKGDFGSNLHHFSLVL